MAHDKHFLSRLSRVNTLQADMALELYRDPERVRYILGQVTLPEGYDRVAIALEDSHDSPHVVVDRHGIFITCLGAGMSFSNLPRITRPQLDRLDSKWQVLNAANERISSTDDVTALRARMLEVGPGMAREDMALLAAMHPLSMDSGLSVSINDDLHEFLVRYRPGRYRKRGRLNQKQRTQLRTYWQLTWCQGHLAVLNGAHTKLLLEKLRQIRDKIPMGEALEQEDVHIPLERLLAWPAMRTLSQPVVLRGAWQVARGGSEMLDVYEAYFAEVSSWTTFVDCSLSLLALGLRYPRTRRRAARILSRRACPFFEEPHVRSYCDAFLDLFVAMLTDSKLRDHMLAHHRLLGGGYLAHLSADFPDDHMHRYSHPDEVPDDLAFPFALCTDGPVLQIHEKLPEGMPPNLYLTAMFLVWASTAELEELYLPASFWDGNAAGWGPDLTLELLDGQRPYTALGKQPVRAAKKIGRNQPCPCGSGQKYKRCCGAPDADPEAAVERPTVVEDYASILAALRGQ